ncbi:MAG: TonB-dependent siderophore receptor [Burkholderiaceae bacterium]|nr:TonB-dependent siderophore receptor [Burkholderiaceae bacterium]
MAHQPPFFKKKAALSSVEWSLFALFFAAGNVSAQTAGADASLKPVTVSERSAAPLADVTGFGDQPLERSPFAATVIDAATIVDTGARRLSDLYRLDASVSDAYNAVGYWDYASMRGFVIDQTSNWRRDGLPISAETSLPLENRERVEFLKGTSGIQAGTSAPGGLVNLVIKRPTEKPLRTLRLETNHRGGLLAHADLGGRFGENRRFGYRLNLAAEDVRSHASGADGSRHLLALAMDWRVSPDTVIEGEWETSRRRQPSVPGLSLTGSTLPAPNPFININTQPWSQANVFDNLSGSLGIQQAINSQWRWQAQIGTQRLKSQDRLAYPYGCFDAGTGAYYADRYCPNGDFDLYDFRSTNERRRTHAAQIRAIGQLDTGAVRHHLSFGVLASRFIDRGEPQADNNSAVGTGNLFTLPVLPPDPTFGDPYTNRTERSTEFFAYDAIQWSPAFQTWLGLRHTRLHRESVRTDGSRATAYTRAISTPWLAATWQLTPATMFYASVGKGVESEVAPGRSRYTNAGQPLPALRSRQTELGVKNQTDRATWSATVFDITRPLWGDAGSCDVAGSCTRQVDGEVRHRGLELAGGWQAGPWHLNGSTTWLDAERRHAVINPGLNGKRPTNVPGWTLRAQVRYRLAAVPGLSVEGALSHEGRRAVLPDESVMLPSWTRLDTALRYETRLLGQRATWSLSVDNVANRRGFVESPYQYSHIYLFPAAPRTVRLGLHAGF